MEHEPKPEAAIVHGAAGPLIGAADAVHVSCPLPAIAEAKVDEKGSPRSETAGDGKPVKVRRKRCGMQPHTTIPVRRVKFPAAKKSAEPHSV